MGLFDNFFNRGIVTDDVIEVLEDINISPNQIKTEKTVENIILKKLREEFEGVHQQYNIGGYLGFKSDIDIGDGRIGIELKLAKSLNNSSSNVQRLFGQVIYYQNRIYTEDNLIVVIIGSPKYKEEPFMSEIIGFLEDLNVEVCYIETKSSR